MSSVAIRKYVPMWSKERKIIEKGQKKRAENLGKKEMQLCIQKDRLIYFIIQSWQSKLSVVLNIKVKTYLNLLKTYQLDM